MKTIRYNFSRKEMISLLEELVNKHANLKDDNWNLFLERLFAIKQRMLAKGKLSTLPSDKEEKKVSRGACVCGDSLIEVPSLLEFEEIRKLDPTDILFQQASDHTLAIKLNEIIDTLNKLIIK